MSPKVQTQLLKIPTGLVGTLVVVGALVLGYCQYVYLPMGPPTIVGGFMDASFIALMSAIVACHQKKHLTGQWSSIALVALVFGLLWVMGGYAPAGMDQFVYKATLTTTGCLSITLVLLISAKSPTGQTHQHQHHHHQNHQGNASRTHRSRQHHHNN